MLNKMSRLVSRPAPFLTCTPASASCLAFSLSSTSLKMPVKSEVLPCQRKGQIHASASDDLAAERAAAPSVATTLSASHISRLLTLTRWF